MGKNWGRIGVSMRREKMGKQGVGERRERRGTEEERQMQGIMGRHHSRLQHGTKEEYMSVVLSVRTNGSSPSRRLYLPSFPRLGLWTTSPGLLLFLF